MQPCPRSALRFLCAFVTAGLSIPPIGCGDDRAGPSGAEGGSGAFGTGATGAGVASGGSGGAGAVGDVGGYGAGPPTAGIDVITAGLDGMLELSLEPGGIALTISEDGTASFARELPEGTAYEVTMTDSPGLQTCALEGATGTLSASSPTLVEVTCRDQLVFVASDSAPADFALWATDGTRAGTRALMDVAPGGGYISQFHDAPGSRVFFVADDGQVDDELWITDGTEAGTRMVRDIYEGSGGSSIDELTSHDGKVYFAAEANDGAGQELWVTDGTEAGTVRVADLNPGDSGSDPRELLSLGTQLFFIAYDGDDNVLFALESDGSSVTELRSGICYESLLAAGGGVFFSADATGFGCEPFVSDGTPQGTTRLGDVESGPEGSNAFGLLSLSSQVLFRANTAAGGYELYRADANGIALVGDFNGGASSSYPVELGLAGGFGLLRMDDGTTGTELWGSDGTLTGTARLMDLELNGGSYHVYLGELPDGIAILSAFANGQRYLIRTDGTVAGTSAFMAFTNATSIGQPRGMLDGRVCFELSTEAEGYEPWCTDGTRAGTTLLLDLCPGPCSSMPVNG